MKHAFALLLVVAAVGGGVLVAQRFFPGMFSIRDVEVKTEWPLSEDRVKGWLPSLQGKSLWKMNGSSLVQELEKQSWVSVASIRKEFPDRLRIEVKPRLPKALWSSKGILWLVDETGKRLERANPAMLKELDLPIVSFESESLEEQWRAADAVSLVGGYEAALDPKFRVSELVLSDYPYFKVFLSEYRLELLYSLDTWRDQIVVTHNLLVHPPSQIGQPRRINLVFPKKAVVSPTISQ